MLPTLAPTATAAVRSSDRPHPVNVTKHSRMTLFIPPFCALKVNEPLPKHRFAATPRRRYGPPPPAFVSRGGCRQAREFRVVDIFDEVEEDLRAERAGKLLKKYAWLMIVVVVAIVGAAVGWQLWNRYQNQQDTTAAARYVAVQNALEQPGGSKAAQIATLDQLAATAPEGYRTLARLRSAGLKADAGDVPGAIALWNAVAADSSADRLLRDLASLLATQRELDHGDPGQLEARLKPLTEPDNPWSAVAQEQLAMLDLRQGRVDDARKKLQLLSFDINSPSGLRARASALLVGLGPQDTK